MGEISRLIPTCKLMRNCNMFTCALAIPAFFLSITQVLVFWAKLHASQKLDIQDRAIAQCDFTWNQHALSI